MSPTLRHIIIWAVIIGLSMWFVNAVSGILLPFVLGAIIAYLMDPLADRLERHMSRTMATTNLTIAAFAVITILLATALPLIGRQFVRLMQTLPEQLQQFHHTHIATWQQWLSSIPGDQEQAVEQTFAGLPDIAGGLVTNFMETIFSSGAAALNIFSLLLITPVVTFYLLRDWDHITAIIRDLLPRRHAAIIGEQLAKMDDTISGFLRGQMLVCTILASFYVIAFSISGLNFGVAIGAAAGFLIIIPYVGWAVAASVGMVIATMQYGEPVMIGITAAIFIFGQVVEGNFLTPSLVGDRVGLHPVWMIFGMLAGAVLLGFVGVLLAVPLTAVIGVLTRFAIEQYKESDLYLDETPPSSVKQSS